MGVLKRLTDDELIRLVNASDEKAFNEVYDRYATKLLAQATYDLRNADEAEECVHDVFIKLWRNRANLNLQYRLSTYLYRAVKNQVINTLEKRHTLRNNLESTNINMQHDFAPSADALLIEKEMLAAMEAAIDLLPDKCAAVYRLSRLEQRSNREISLELGIAEKTVEGHITRAIKNISNAVISSTVTSLILIFLKF